MKAIPGQKEIEAIMEKAIQINAGCKEQCRDFRIMTSLLRPDTLVLRWTTIDIDDIDNPLQCYRYQCFHSDGTPQNCSIYYSDQQQANQFFQSLKTLHKQAFSHDHKM